MQIYEIGEQQGRPYFALELVEGGNLAQRLAVLPLPAAEAAQLVRTLARAMHHAHEQGIIHRDLKPANVLLTREGQAKITDFGLAKELEAEVFLTHSRSGLLLGTPSYMAPEQVRGPSRNIGPGADIYGIGAILYEALTGHPPFIAHSLLEVLDQVRSQEPLLPSRRHSPCPRNLEVICLKCLRKEPGQRYATAAELADDLDRHLQGQPIRARPAGLGERSLKWMRRHPAAVSALIAAVVLTAATAGAVRYLQQQTVQMARDRHDQENARDEFRKAQYPIQLARVEQIAAGGDMHQARKLLQECHPERRGWEWRYLWGVSNGKSPLEQHAHNGSVLALASHPAAPRLASGGMDRGLYHWDLPNLQNQSISRLVSSEPIALAFAPEGDRLAVAHLYRSAKEPILPPAEPIKPPPREKVDQPDRPDMQTWFVAKAEKEPPIKMVQQAKLLRPSVLVWDARMRKQLFSLPEQPLPVTALAFSPDGRYLATAYGVFVPVNFPPAEPVPLPLPPMKPPAPKKAAPAARLWQGGEPWRAGGEGDLLAWEDVKKAPRGAAGGPPFVPGPLPKGGRMTLWDTRTGKEFQTVSLPVPVLSLAIHPREPVLAAGCEDGTVRLWDYRNGKMRILVGHHRRVRSVAFNGKGDMLASAGQDNTVRLWDPATGAQRFLLRDHSAAVLELAFSPDGDRLASASEDRTIKLWDAVRGEQLLTLRGHQGSVTCLVFAAEGRCLVSGDTEGNIRVWQSPSEASVAAMLSAPASGRKEKPNAPPPRMERLPVEERVPMSRQSEPREAIRPSEKASEK